MYSLHILECSQRAEILDKFSKEDRKNCFEEIYSWRIGGFKAKNKLKNYVFVTHYLTGKLAKVPWCQQKSGQVFRVKAEILRKTGRNT